MKNGKDKPQGKERLQVNVELHGEIAERFLAYQKKELMPNKASTGFKLIVERLNEVLPATP